MVLRRSLRRPGACPRRPRRRRRGCAVSAVRASVVVCTRNRRAAFEECLGTLTAQVALPEGLEIVVVDNGSSDGTAEWLARWRAEDPTRRRTVVEPVGGSVPREEPWCRRRDGRSRPLRRRRRGRRRVAGSPRTWRPSTATRTIVGVGGPVVLTWPVGPAALALDRFSSTGSAPSTWATSRGRGPTPTVRTGRTCRSDGRRYCEAGGFCLSLGRRGPQPDLRRGEGARRAALGTRRRRSSTSRPTLVLHRVQVDRDQSPLGPPAWWAQGRSNARLRVTGAPSRARAELCGVCRDELGHLGRDGPRLLRALAHRDEARVPRRSGPSCRAPVGDTRTDRAVRRRPTRRWR